MDGVHGSHSLFGVVRVVFGQPDLSGHQCTSQKINTKSDPEGSVRCLRTVDYPAAPGHFNVLYFSQTEGLSKLKLLVLLMG